MSRHARRTLIATALLLGAGGLVWASCSGDSGDGAGTASSGAPIGAATPQHSPLNQGRPPTPPAVEHDFGVIPHGESRTHDYVLDTTLLAGGPFVPLRTRLDCGCGRPELVLRAEDGSERVLDGRPLAANAQRPGETVICRVTLETHVKDPVDLPAAASKGFVVLQPVDDRTGLRRVHWPLILRFGIDCPVTVKPFAAVDFETVPQSRTPTIPLRLSGDENHPNVRFGPVRSDNPELTVELGSGAESDRTELRLTCHPGAPGNARAIVSVATDLPDYAVNIAVTWKVVPDLVASPMAKLSFRTPLGNAQEAKDATAQYRMIANHDESTSQEFCVRQLVDQTGRDAASHFEVRFEPVPGRQRHSYMYVRYLGGLDEPFRGKIVVGPTDAEDHTLDVALVLFDA